MTLVSRPTADRVQNRAILDEIIVPILATRPSSEWIQRLGAADILCGPINTFADVAADPNLVSGLPLVDPLAPNVPLAMGVPIRRDGAYTATDRPAPAKGQHTQEVLTEFGFGPEEIQALIDEGAAFLVDQDLNS